jgi:trehalose/maltose hydrolase-like predicted phosphorylase
MAGNATLRVGTEALVPDRPFSLRWVWRWRSVAGQVVALDRIVAAARADRPEDDPTRVANEALAHSRALGWRAVLAAHEAAWKQRWLASDVVIEGDDEVQRALRFAIYHLISAANPEDERVSVGARGLTGDAYFGHVFWDTEIYLLPFYTAVWPEAARAMLMYRFHTLSGARTKAAHMGWKGALYAWESADTGEETTPERVMGSDGALVDILTGTMEQHISADVAYAVWQYWRVTGDDEFFLQAGAEILLETARFWASRALAEADGGRHIRHVIGPDEYHEDVDDNAFTNVMARWNIARGLEAIEMLRARWTDRATALCEKLALRDEELADWRDAAARIVTGLDRTTGLYEEFAGFHQLEPLDLSLYADRKVPIDVVIGRERTLRSQVVKQADVVALMALLPDEFPGAMPEVNFHHYEPRCAHGSSLSAGMHALVAARLGETEMALRYLHKAAVADLELDPNSAGGIRIAGLGAVWQAVVLGFAGVDLTGDTLAIEPRLPHQWRSLSFRVRWRGRSVAIRIAGGTVQATLVAGDAIEIRVAGKVRALTGVAAP